MYIISEILLNNDCSLSERQITYNINICPDKFKTNFAIININEQWLINLSDTKIPEKAEVVLQLGQQFNLPNNVISKEKSMLEFIKHIECNLFKTDDEICKTIKNEAIQILKSDNCEIKSTKMISYEKV